MRSGPQKQFIPKAIPSLNCMITWSICAKA